MNIGSAITEFRKNAGFSQRQLAKNVGITPSYLCQVELGRRHPSSMLLKRISSALNIPPEVLFWEAMDVPTDLPQAERDLCEQAKKIVRRYAEAVAQGNESN